MERATGQARRGRGRIARVPFLTGNDRCGRRRAGTHLLGNAEVGLKLTSFASAPSEPQNTRMRVARSARRVHIAACVRARVAVRPVGVNGSKFHSCERRRGVAPGADDENPHHPGPSHLRAPCVSDPSRVDAPTQRLTRHDRGCSQRPSGASPDASLRPPSRVPRARPPSPKIRRSAPPPYLIPLPPARPFQGKKIRVKCNEDDTIGDLKKLVAAQTGTRPEKLRIQKWYNIYKDHITLEDYEIHDGMGLELYYN